MWICSDRRNVRIINTEATQGRTWCVSVDVKTSSPNNLTELNTVPANQRGGECLWVSLLRVTGKDVGRNTEGKPALLESVST